ncbi:hypothetical protein, partial [Morganella morganii]|uniref:hypothetical protein n=1 Tax=Morganella morganii TaxID=582 RepID=UPI001BDAC7EB
DSGNVYCDFRVEYIPDNSVISICGTNKKCPVRTGQVSNRQRIFTLTTMLNIQAILRANQ